MSRWGSVDYGGLNGGEEPQKEACSVAVGGLYQGTRCLSGAVRFSLKLTTAAQIFGTRRSMISLERSAMNLKTTRCDWFSPAVSDL